MQLGLAQKRTHFTLGHIWSIFTKLIRKICTRDHMLIAALGFLLGRAVIFQELAPFGLAYSTVFFCLAHSQRRQLLASFALLFGAFSFSLALFGQLLLGLLLLKVLHKLAISLGWEQVNYLPALAACSSLGVQILTITYYGNFILESWLFLLAQVMLTFLLTCFFLCSVPLILSRRKKVALDSTEFIALLVLVGTLFIGIGSLQVADLSLGNCLASYMVLVIAFIGGPLFGAALGLILGVITGLIKFASFEQASAWAFGGLLAGLFYERRKIGVLSLFLLGVFFLDLHTGFQVTVLLSEAFWAGVLFLLTPRKYLLKLGRYIPGSTEHSDLHQSHLHRFKELTAKHIEQFRELFEELAFSFQPNKCEENNCNEERMQKIIENSMNRTCKGCHRYQACWDWNVMQTFQGMTDLVTKVQERPKKAPLFQVPAAWANYCVRSKKMLEAVKLEQAACEENILWQDKLRKVQRMVSGQLKGLAQVLDGLILEVRQEKNLLVVHEKEIKKALANLRLNIQQVDIFNLKRGHVEIDLTMPTTNAIEVCKTMVAPLLSEILGEPIGVFKRIMDKNEALVTILLGSLQKYTFKTGVAKIAKEGGDVSGDSYCYMPLGTGKYLIALSDGMGTGDRAHDESLSAINLLRKLLRAGVDVEKVLDTVNAILRLRSKEEMFATLDLAVIDTSTGMGSFVKVGSTPGFIKHKKGITPLVAQAPPAGILARIEVKPVIHKLQADDFLIMMTDGAYDALEQDLPALLKQITVKDSQLFADQVLARVLAQNVNDDVTVLVSKMEPYVPEWATFSSCR